MTKQATQTPRVTSTAVRRRPKRPDLSGNSPARRIGKGLIWLFVAFNLLLLAWVVLQSFRSTREIFTSPWGLPTTWLLDNWVQALGVSGFGRATLNSLNVTVIAAFVTVALAAPAAYYLSRQENRFTQSITIFFVLGLGVPAQVILIPLFMMLSRVGLTDSLLGLNLVYISISMPFTVYLLTAFFRSLPSELEEAAALDGASPARTFWVIMFPLARGGFLTAFVLQVISNWNETLLALTVLQTTDRFTLPVALISFAQQQTYSGANWGGLFAGLCVVILPMILVYIWIGRRLTEGLTLGVGK